MAASTPGNNKTWSYSSAGIIVEKRPPESRLSELGVKSWPKWAGPAGKYTVRYEAEQTCYYLRGKVKVSPKGSGETVEFGAGDLVTIPKGLRCTMDVSAPIDKHYKFAPPT